MKNNKVIFVGPENIHAAFVRTNKYDFQKPITSISEFFKEMKLPENESKISRDSSVIILFSRLYTGDEANFSKLVALYSPYAVVAILTPEQDKESVVPKIETLVRSAKRSLKSQNPSYDVGVPSYFISYENPQHDLIEAMVKYVSDTSVDRNVREYVMQMLPEHYKNAVEVEAKFERTTERLEEMYSDTDKIVLPEDEADHPGKVIAVTSSKGGSGKSTVSMVLAAYLAKSSQLSEEQNLERERLKICVVDFDTRDGQLGFLNGVTSPTVLDIFSDPSVEGVKIPRETIKKGIYSSKTLGADFIFASRRGRYAKDIQPQFYVSLIHELKALYDYIILDTSVNYLDALLEEVAYPMADKIIFVTDMGVSSIFGMARWISETTKDKSHGGSGIDSKKIGITVNKVMDGINMSADRIKKTSMGLPIIAMLPNVPKLVTYKANTNSLEDVLDKRQINIAFSSLAKQVVEDNYNLASVPYSDS